VQALITPFQTEAPLKIQSFYSQFLVAAAMLGSCAASVAQAPLANQPVLSNTAVPGNLALALSVEWPTVVNPAHINNTYDINATYLGYFDPKKCYAYSHSASEAARHFYPTGLATAPSTCASAWSGNFLNWATMQAIDPFRWVLSGGYRSTDTAGTSATPGVTILEKAWASGQGGFMFPNRTLSSNVTASTPLGFANVRMRAAGRGNKLVFTGTGDPNAAATAFTGGVADANTVYEVSVRVKVCDPAIGTLGESGLESNCIRYGTGPSYTYKPEGLLQKYADRIRYSAFGYLNDSTFTRDGGVLRARQAFIGPLEPVPFNPSIVNPVREWDAATGVMFTNPAPADATKTNTDFLLGVGTVANSGVMNYLNKFGQISPGDFKSFDPVSEMYYAAVRYFKNLGNVPEWTEMTAASLDTRKQYADYFPVIVTTAGNTADDPILYSCQKNFVLGIGDVYTHRDKNVPGSSIAGGPDEPAIPGTLSTDPIQSTLMTNRVGTMEGMSAVLGTINPPYGSQRNSYLMAGIALDSHTRDIRPDVTGQPKTLNKQTIKTFWLDVLENQNYESKNAFWLTAKYGGFTVPNGFDPDNPPASLPISSWYTTGRVSPTGQQLPDTYFLASRPDQVLSGLTAAFENISNEIGGVTTGAATAQPQVLATGAASYSASYKTEDWSGDVIAKQRVFGSTTVPLEYWKFSEKLSAQTPSSRVMATWNGSSGIPFAHTSLTTAQKAALDTTMRPGDDSADYLNYLRGDNTYETTTPKYRTRANLVGDIVDSSLTAVGRPNLRFTEYFNPGYKAFKTTWYDRKTVLYVGTNAGVLHAINGAPCTSSSAANCSGAAAADIDANAGKEMFAYVPSALFVGPSVPATPATNGLAALGNPNYVHRNFVNSTAVNFDIDTANTVEGKIQALSASAGSCKNPDSTSPSYWKTVLIGGLGKGGKSYYALDVTNPFNITPPAPTGPALTEADMASKVMWEFPRTADLTTYPNLNQQLGYSFGAPVVVKTAQHGWVVIFTSGYNNTDGKGYFFVVDACTGLLVHAPIATGAGTVANEAGMAHPTAFVLDAADGKADAAYAGDLLGNVWRLDLRAGTFAAVERIALLKNSAGVTQPITSRPLVELCPKTLDRFVMIGTGRLLDEIDIGNIDRQTYYAFKDGNNVVFDTLLTTTNSVVRADLVDVSDNLINSATAFTTQRGWYIEVGKNEVDLGWRVIRPSSSFFGQVAFVGMLPNGTDACARSATGLLYGINFCSAKSVLLQTSGTGPATAIVAKKLTGDPLPPEWKNAGGTPTVSACTSTGDCPPLEIVQRAATPSRQLNWREIPIAE
jgi:type IV pilus assembly protein PilY1